MIRLLNRTYQKVNHQKDIFIHRGTPLGNPYTHLAKENTKAEFQVETREEAIAMYKVRLDKKIAERDPAVCGELNRIFLAAKQGDVNLVCYCFPKPCHGQIIIDLIESKLKKQLWTLK